MTPDVLVWAILLGVLIAAGSFTLGWAIGVIEEGDRRRRIGWPGRWGPPARPFIIDGPFRITKGPVATIGPAKQGDYVSRAADRKPANWPFFWPGH